MDGGGETSQTHTDTHTRCLSSSPLLELDLGLSPGFAFEGGVSEDVLVDDSLVQGDIHRVSGGAAAVGSKVSTADFHRSHETPPPHCEKHLTVLTHRATPRLFNRSLD